MIRQRYFGKICLQGCFKRVFAWIFHCGARGYSKVYAGRNLLRFGNLTLSDGVQLPSRTCHVHLSRVRIPPCVGRRIAGGSVCPSGRKNGTRKPRFRVRERFYPVICYHSAKNIGAMQKQALSESGYRVFSNRCQKERGLFRTLSALGREH